MSRRYLYIDDNAVQKPNIVAYVVREYCIVVENVQLPHNPHELLFVSKSRRLGANDVAKHTCFDIFWVNRDNGLASSLLYILHRPLL